MTQHERTGALSTLNNQSVFVYPKTIICMATQQGGAEIRTDDRAPTLTAAAGMSGNNQPVVYDARGNGDGKTVCTITDDHENRITDYTALCIGNGQAHSMEPSKVVGALNCMHDQQAVYIQRVAHTLRGSHRCAHREDEDTYVVDSFVRRLTPLECDRLQGYPDDWTQIGDWIDGAGKRHETSDSNRYKADGNSIALPFWFWLLRRISAQYERPATLGSLFDGIGGFPLCWERCNGKGAARWASEIEEFPIAVTKFRFGEE